MKLILSEGYEPKNATLSLPNGQPMYYTDTPLQLIDRTTTIYRAESNQIQPTSRDGASQFQFAPMAQIEWHKFDSTILRFEGSEFDSDSLFRTTGFGWYGSSRIFLAPDGNEYKWKFGTWDLSLYKNDGSRQLVAEYHRSWLGMFGDSWLEIYPSGAHMTDIIVITFVYAEKIWRDRKRARRR
ncbi:hypothetical protein EYR38_001696 [Pleurotus pulmonarius]|nr:hypothetical protein EYR38_001696 [Pleurotus pulmonarius]